MSRKNPQRALLEQGMMQAEYAKYFVVQNVYTLKGLIARANS